MELLRKRQAVGNNRMTGFDGCATCASFYKIPVGVLLLCLDSPSWHIVIRIAVAPDSEVYLYYTGWRSTIPKCIKLT